MHFIGSNDAETLTGVLEEIDAEIRVYEARARTATTQRDRRAAEAAGSALRSLRATVENAIPNGPTPTAEDLGRRRLRLSDADRARLTAARQ